jgi:hypothetical protein
MLNDADLRLLKYLWNRGRTGWSQAACYDRAFPHNRHVSPQAKSQYIKSRSELPEWKREWQALDDAAREEVQQSVRDFTRTLADRSRDPYERFAGFEFAQVERSNETTGEILGFEVAPAVRDITEISEDLLPYVRQLRWEPTAGMFIIVPRETVDQKTRAKYADMFARTTGLYAPERLELTGKDGAPVATISAEMTSVEASEVYRNVIKGVAPTPGKK